MASLAIVEKQMTSKHHHHRFLQPCHRGFLCLLRDAPQMPRKDPRDSILMEIQVHRNGSVKMAAKSPRFPLLLKLSPRKRLPLPWNRSLRTSTQSRRRRSHRLQFQLLPISPHILSLITTLRQGILCLLLPITMSTPHTLPQTLRIRYQHNRPILLRHPQHLTNTHIQGILPNRPRRTLLTAGNHIIRITLQVHTPRSPTWLGAVTISSNLRLFRSSHPRARWAILEGNKVAKMKRDECANHIRTLFIPRLIMVRFLFLILHA